MVARTEDSKFTNWHFEIDRRLLAAYVHQLSFLNCHAALLKNISAPYSDFMRDKNHAVIMINPGFIISDGIMLNGPMVRWGLSRRF